MQQAKWFEAYLNAISWVKEIGDITAAACAQQPLQIHTKSHRRDLVTQYDTAAEAFLTEKIRAAYPEHRICAEESQSAGTGEIITDLAGPVWFLDPIDGTINFARQGRDWGVMLALYEDGRPQLGVVYDPVRGDMYSALSGFGAYKNGQSLPMLPAVSLADSLVIIEGGAVRQGDAQTLAVLERCLSGRMVGASAIVTGMLASAGCGAFLSQKQMPWDAAAPRAILEEIGAVFTLPDGSRPSLLKGGPYLMALPRIHQEIVDLYLPPSGAGTAGFRQ